MQNFLTATNSLSQLQHGYKENTSSTEAVYSLTQLIQRRKYVEGKATYCAFIDFVTAFPTVCRPSLWDAVHSHGISGKTWRILHEMYAKPECQVIHPHITDTFQINKGVREGSRLSPLLYTIFVDSLIKKLQQSKLGAHATGQLNNLPFSQWMGAILYADDIVLIAEDPTQLQKMLDIVQEWSQNHYATISLKKTYVMSFHTEKLNSPTQPLHHSWNITDTTSDTPIVHKIKTCTTFTYLGVLLDQTLSFGPATKQVLASFWYAHRKIQNYGAHKHGLSPYLISYLWKSMVMSKLTNTLPFIYKEDDIKKVQNAINKSIKHLTTPESTIRSFLPIPVCADLGIPSAELFRALLLSRFYAHLNVIPYDRPASILHQLQKHTITTLSPGAANPTPHKEFFDTSIKAILNILQLSHQWTHITIPPPPNSVHGYPPHKKERSWTQQIAHPALLSLQQRQFKAWATSPERQNPEGRPFIYHHYTATDHDENPLHRKDIFTPATYLKHAHSSTMAMAMLRMRTQMSILPTHQPYENDMHSDHAYQYTDYAYRYCPHQPCQIPQPWGNMHPMRAMPAGNELHYILKCPQYTAHRHQCSVSLDSALSMIHHSLPNKAHPWSCLSDSDKISSLLAATPPRSWNLSRKAEILWMESSSELIYDFWRPIISDFSKKLRTADFQSLPFSCNSHSVTPTE